MTIILSSTAILNASIIIAFFVFFTQCTYLSHVSNFNSDIIMFKFGLNYSCKDVVLLIPDVNLVDLLKLSTIHTTIKQHPRLNLRVTERFSYPTLLKHYHRNRSKIF